MREWKRWQDYATMMYGVLLFISPFVFGETSEPVPAAIVYVLGALLVLAGIVAAATREGRRSVIMNAPGMVAVITFFSPWVLVFSGVTGIAWTAWVMAILTILTAATIRVGRRAQMRTA